MSTPLFFNLPWRGPYVEMWNFSAAVGANADLLNIFKCPSNKVRLILNANAWYEAVTTRVVKLNIFRFPQFVLYLMYGSAVLGIHAYPCYLSTQYATVTGNAYMMGDMVLNMRVEGKAGEDIQHGHLEVTYIEAELTEKEAETSTTPKEQPLISAHGGWKW